MGKADKLSSLEEKKKYYFGYLEKNIDYLDVDEEIVINSEEINVEDSDVSFDECDVVKIECELKDETEKAVMKIICYDPDTVLDNVPGVEENNESISID